MSTYRYNTLNVFSHAETGGNPLAVFVNATGLADSEMQGIARDLQLSETVFVLPPEAKGRVRLRIFTPNKELSFAGHPVVGASFILGAHLVIPRLHLETKAGVVEVELERSGDFLHRAHLRGPEARALEVSPNLVLEALGQRDSAAGLLLPRAYLCGAEHVLVELPGRAELDRLEPHMARLARALPNGGVYAFSRRRAAGPQAIDVRYFAPGAGVPEDPATGSGAIALGQYLLDEGAWDGQTSLQIFQGAHLGHASRLEISLRSDGSTAPALYLSGEAFVTGRGERIVRSDRLVPSVES